MSGLAARTKNIPGRKPAKPDCIPAGYADENLFFRHVSTVAEIQRKEWAYSLRVTKGLVDFWFNGTKRDPFTIARDALSEISSKRPDLRPAVLTYIAGGEDGFDEVLMTRLQEVFARRLP